MSLNLPLARILSPVMMTTVMAIVLCTAPAKALRLSNSAGTWSDPLGGTDITFPRVGDESQVRWGTPSGSEFNSGLGFTGVGASTIEIGEIFQIGILRHFNNSVLSGTALSSIDLKVGLTFVSARGLLPSQKFGFTFNIDETSNVGFIADCPYPSTMPCSDQIFFPLSLAPTPFKLDSVDYTLQLLGFSKGSSDPILTGFISDENQANTTFLYGRISAVPLQPRTVSEPGMLLGFASLGAYFVARRLRQQHR